MTINGVKIKDLKTFEDERGWLKEIYRIDEDPIISEMCYISHTKLNQIRGPHEHVHQSDFFVFPGPGDFELFLWDDRPQSSTFGNSERIVLGESRNATVLVPPGVVHGYKSISEKGSFSINLPDKLYAGLDKKEKVDEIRHENNPNSPFQIK